MATLNPYSDSLLMDAFRGSLSNAESLGRGFAVAPVGLLGDVNALARQYITPRLPQSVQGLLQAAPAAPTTEQILSNIPRASAPRMETSGMEQLGAAMNPRGPVELAKAVKNMPVGLSIKPVDDVVGLLTPKIDKLTGLPLNADGTVTLFHHTNKSAAEQIAKTGRLKSAGEPSVYLTTQKATDTGYGDVAVPVRVKPSLLNLDDEFPSGRMDFSIDTGKPKGSIPVTVEKPSFTYPQEEAMRLAQQRAALPKEQFGLGLPPNNTAQQRADAMFPFDVYHGTNADIQVMNTAGKGKTSGAGAFVNDNPLAAETYVNASGGGNIIPMRMSKEGLLDVNAKGRNWADIETNTLAPKAGKKRYSLDEMELQKNDVTSTDELGMIAKDLLGLQGVNIKNVKDLGPNSHIFRAKEYLQDKYGIVPDETWSNVTGNQFGEARDYMDKLYKSQKSTVTAVQDPDLLRSRFAAFDPFRKTAATAAAMGVAAPDLLAQEQPVITQQQIDDELAKYGLLGR